jgi:hypothetical protein
MSSSILKAHHDPQPSFNVAGSPDEEILQFHFSEASLRRTVTTFLHEAGVPSAVAQALIGHDSEAMHELYISVGREALEKDGSFARDLKIWMEDPETFRSASVKPCLSPSVSAVEQSRFSGYSKGHSEGLARA